MAMRRKTTHTVVAIDLDGLEQVNDAEGHEAGDAMIAGFARCSPTRSG